MVCVGAGACRGGQACLADGTGYGPCECGNGGTDAAPVDGAAHAPDAGVIDAPACLTSEPADAEGITCTGTYYNNTPVTEQNVYVWFQGNGVQQASELLLDSQLVAAIELRRYGTLLGALSFPETFFADYVGSAFLTNPCYTSYGFLLPSPSTTVTVMIDSQRSLGNPGDVLSAHCRGTGQLHYGPP